MNQNFYNSNSLGFDQTQPPQFPIIHPPPQETGIVILHDQENTINSMHTFLRKFNRYSFFETPKVLLLAWDRLFKIKDTFGNKQYKPEDIQELFRELFNDVQNIHEELAEYINTPGWNRPTFYNNGDDDDEDCTIAITPDFLITDSLIMGDKHLETIPEKESDEFIKSSVENLVSNPSDDDEPSLEEVIHEMSFKTYSNPLFDLDEEIISSEFNPIHNEDLDSTPKNDRFDTKSYLLESLLNRDESIPSGIDCDESDSEGDNLFLERLLHDDPIPLPDTLDFSNDVRVFLPFFTYPDAFENKQYKPEDIQELFRELFNDVQNIHEELAEYINTPGGNRPAFYNNGDDDDEDCTIAITPDFLITDSLIMGDKHLDTILEKESDEFIKSSVENLVSNPSEFEDECECDVPDCDDSQTTNFLTFSKSFFDDSTSSDDELSHEEVIHKMSFKTYSNPLFDLDEEIISSEFNPIHDEDLYSTLKNDRFDTKSYLLESLLNRDESIPSGVDCDDSDSEGDNLFLERLLHDDPSTLSDTLNFLNDVRVFLPLFTYPVTSSILFSSGSEDIIFNPGIYHFSSLEPGVSHRSGTFMKFNIYPNHLNKSPM
nr:hypothetical protein [Tanacetum cinerariifolium]